MKASRGEIKIYEILKELALEIQDINLAEITKVLKIFAQPIVYR